MKLRNIQHRIKRGGGLRLLALLYVAHLLTSCGQLIDSKVSQITASTLRCSVDSQRSQMIQNLYSKNFVKGNYLVAESADNLSNVPDEYLVYVFDKYKTPFTMLGKSGTGGVTGIGWDRGPYGNIEYGLYVKSDVLSLRHEFGHATMGETQYMMEGFDSELYAISKTILQRYNYKTSSYLRSYKSNDYSRVGEVYAELFDTWYCSEEARQRVREGMPEVYDFAVKYLRPPLDGAYSKGPSSKNVNVVINQSNYGQDLYFKVNTQLSGSLKYCVGTQEFCSSSYNLISTTSLGNGYYRSQSNVQLGSIVNNSSDAIWIVDSSSNSNRVLRSVRISN